MKRLNETEKLFIIISVIIFIYGIFVGFLEFFKD